MSNTDTAVTSNLPSGRRRWNATDLGLIGVFAALVAGAALVPGLAVNGFGVPITFQTLAVMLTGLVLGPGRGFAAVGLYTLLGLAGLPIFSQGRSGLSILAGPSAGYIIAFPIAAALVGWLATVVIRRTTKARALWFFLAATVTSILTVHTLGVAGIALNAKTTLGQAFLSDVVFYPGDIIKNILAAGIAVALHRAFPDILVRRARRSQSPVQPAKA
ncbi:BioY protein [Pseudarthrobacter chlorophenolicus A6]|uniref:Biotin transporter n=1 Tax=Pseudarthrobacter chlorophenolicus (strain ATCC 700700 / DSM 12829 / CIP 107037 / JCM 12360 / KCTC 9906 / NCIMB 13794 / A6) TaxID=452863 RepID=B8H7Q1_PSECP|nr:biotin transporter BioY [Pseudarthrobacter chlorophenolicus]ACL39831.1 BioY protein [Pseudarthrobacter chlorophenolicus A6]SDQ93005.1 biotin transport system substrate-specific component [Pseudarthrobacter chlorophenolicus]